MKIFLSDFDGTIVNKDILDVVCDITGHREDSERLNADVISGKVNGLQPLVDRINFLKGVSRKQIFEKLDENNYLIDGVKDFFKYLKSSGFIIVLHTGNIEYVAEYYKEILGIDYIVCTKPLTKDGVIDGITIDDLNNPNFKKDGCMDIIERCGVSVDNIFAMGDSIVDKKVFDIATHTIAINPKGGIEQYAKFVVSDGDYKKVMDIIGGIIK